MDLLLNETAKLCIENKSEDEFINQSAYFFGNILYILWVLTMIHSEGTMYHVYIQESHQDRFNKISD